MAWGKDMVWDRDVGWDKDMGWDRDMAWGWTPSVGAAAGVPPARKQMWDPSNPRPTATLGAGGGHPASPRPPHGHGGGAPPLPNPGLARAAWFEDAEPFF